MIDGIINNKLKHTKLDIDKNDDIFKNKMEIEDAEVKLWFKLNILRSQTGLINSFKIKVTSDYLLNEAKFLTKRDQNLYEINTTINLMNVIQQLNLIIKEKSKLSNPFLHEDYLDKVFRGLDLFYYKKDHFGYLYLIDESLDVIP
jgi:hypothetical protein